MLIDMHVHMYPDFLAKRTLEKLYNTATGEDMQITCNTDLTEKSTRDLLKDKWNTI